MIVMFLKWLLSKLEGGNTTSFTVAKTALLESVNGMVFITASDDDGTPPTEYPMAGGQVFLIQPLDAVTGVRVHQLELHTADGVVTIDVGSKVNINVNGTCGDVTAITGNVSANSAHSISTVTGSVDVVNLYDPSDNSISIHTTSGDVVVDVALHSVYVGTTSGDVAVGQMTPSDGHPDGTVDDPGDEPITVMVTTTSGDVNLHTNAVGTSSISTISGDVEVTAESFDGGVTATATSGDIRIISGFAHNHARVQASSSSGDVTFTTRSTTKSHHE